METKRERARPLSPDERRAAIITATRPLLLEHGRRTTTQLIAEAAGIAEGTIFRIFPTKEDLYAAVMDAEFDPDPLLAELERLTAEGELRERMLVLTRLMQQRFASIFQLMIAMGVPRPPAAREAEEEAWRMRAVQRMVAVLEPNADQFRMPPQEVVRLLRLLTFAGTHPHITDQRKLDPEEIVDVILHGTLSRAEDA